MKTLYIIFGVLLVLLGLWFLKGIIITLLMIILGVGLVVVGIRVIRGGKKFW